jgi:hypothetical protein
LATKPTNQTVDVVVTVNAAPDANRRLRALAKLLLEKPPADGKEKPAGDESAGDDEGRVRQ